MDFGEKLKYKRHELIEIHANSDYPYLESVIYFDIYELPNFDQ
jgi:hypothetical protein